MQKAPLLFYAGCPGNTCECGRKNILREDPTGENNKAVALVGKTLDDVIQALEQIENETGFLAVRKELKNTYDVEVLTWVDLPIQIRKTPGLCKKSRRRIFNTLNRVNTEYPKILQNLFITETVNDKSPKGNLPKEKLTFE